MSESQQGQGPGKGTHDPGARAVQRAGDGAELNPAEERSALDYLLGAPAPALYTVEVQYETPRGLLPLRLHFAALDGKVLDKIEASNVSAATGVMDKAKADAELVCEAVSEIEDPATGRKTQLRSEEFRTVKSGEPPLASSIDALNFRFRKQPGLIAGVASAIREAAGWKADRVAKASRVLVDAAGN